MAGLLRTDNKTQFQLLRFGKSKHIKREFVLKTLKGLKKSLPRVVSRKMEILAPGTNFNSFQRNGHTDMS